MTLRLSLLCLVLATLALVGCQRGSSPVAAPAEPSQATAAPDTPARLGLIGGYALTLDESTAEASLTPLREGALGESYLVSGTNFFQGPLCGDCLRVRGVTRVGGQIALRLRVEHPFPAGDTGAPPSGSNRLDLDVFDLALLWQNISGTPETYTQTGASLVPGLIADADGYTRELSALLGDPNALPFTLVVNESGAATHTNNRFAMGSATEIEALLDLAPGEAVSLRLWLTMGYGASATRPTRLAPVYYNPEFNRKNAWKVLATPPPAVPSQTWDAGNTTAYPVQVAVWDWQQGATVDPGLGTPDTIAAASDVAEVSVEIPGMATSLPSSSTPGSGTGAPDDPLIYDIFVPNDNLLAAGDYIGLVKVTDQRIPPSPVSGGTVDSVVHAQDDLALTWEAIPEFATYQTFIAMVLPGGGGGTITVGKVEGSRKAMVGQPFTFHVEASIDPTGPSLTYNWDNGENTPGTYDDGTATDDGDIQLTFAAPGTYLVDVEVTDGFDFVTSPQPLAVEVFATGVLVDGDNTGDPLEDGSWAHPFDLIDEGVVAAGAGGRVFIDVAATDYAAFNIVSNLTYIGIDRDNAGGMPSVTWSSGHDSSSDTQVTICGLEFDVSALPLRFFSSTSVDILDCRFTGQVHSTIATAIATYTVNDLLIQGCEIVNLKNTMTPAESSSRLVRPILLYSSSNNVTIMQNEFHNIGFTTAPDAGFYNSAIMDMIMCFGSSNTTVKNNLFHDINNYANLYPGGYTYMSITNAHTQSSAFTWAYNTIHDIDIAVGGQSGTGTSEIICFNMFTDPGVAPDLRGNIIEISLPTITTNERIAGYSGNCCQPGPFPVTYSCTYMGSQGVSCTGASPCYWRAFQGTFTKGTGSYDQQDNVDPMLDLTPGPGWYHPLNSIVATGGESGTEMGCFGGPDGDWIPPSQL